MTIINSTSPPITGTSEWENIDSSESLKSIDRKVGSQPNPESKGFCAWVSRLIDYLGGVFGDRLSSSALNNKLDSVFSTENGWTKAKTFENGGVEQTAWREKKVAGVNYIVSAPAHDLKDEGTRQAHLAGGRSVSRTLAEIKDAYPEGKVKALVPIAQSNSLAFGAERGHFVLLEVDLYNGQIGSATIHDSKGGLIDTLYNGAHHLTLRLHENQSLELDKSFSVTVNHRGEQSLLNGKDCGRYTTYYAATIAEKGDLKQAGKERALEFFKKNF